VSFRVVPRGRGSGLTTCWRGGFRSPTASLHAISGNSWGKPELRLVRSRAMRSRASSTRLAAAGSGGPAPGVGTAGVTATETITLPAPRICVALGEPINRGGECRRGAQVAIQAIVLRCPGKRRTKRTPPFPQPCGQFATLWDHRCLANTEAHADDRPVPGGSTLEGVWRPNAARPPPSGSTVSSRDIRSVSRRSAYDGAGRQ